MFMSMPKGSSSPDDDDEIELSLGLSIGRGFGKSPKLQNSGEELTDVVVTSPNTAVRNWFLRCESDSRHGDTEGNCRERKRKRNETPERSIERETVDSIGCKTNSSDPQVLVVRSFSLNQGDRELVAGGGFSGGNDDENAKGISPAGSSSVLSSGFKSSASQQDGSLKSGEEGRIDPVGIHSEVISKPNMNGPSCCRHGGAKNHTPPPANTQFEETHNTQQDLRQPRIPCVSTTGNGPNGRTVSGFLYKYTNAAEVSIVCVCHGRSFSPAQFVEHAGGVNISHPLRHITVIPSTFHPFAS